MTQLTGKIALVTGGSRGIGRAICLALGREGAKILVNYAKRQVGNKLYGGQASHLPLKLNMAGVIPPIFASSIILFPATVAGWFGQGDQMVWLKDLGAAVLFNDYK